MRGALLLGDQKIREQHEQLKGMIKLAKRLVFIGNGGSFQGHMAHDFLKVGNKPTITPDSPSLLTCLFNDYEKEWVYTEWLKRIWQSGDLLIAVSSSGKSENIVRAVRWNRDMVFGFPITITGFEKDNPVSKEGFLNVWFNTKSYGIHECYTQIFLHSILDDLVGEA